jgi:hypothetical protein
VNSHQLAFRLPPEKVNLYFGMEFLIKNESPKVRRYRGQNKRGLVNINQFAKLSNRVTNN